MKNKNIIVFRKAILTQKTDGSYFATKTWQKACVSKSIIFGAVLVATIVIMVGALALSNLFNRQSLPYQLIEHGIYDNIAYIGNGRFFVSSRVGFEYSFGVYDFSQSGRVVIPFGQFNLPNEGHAIFKHGFVVADDDGLIIKNLQGTEIARFNDAIEAYILNNDRLALRRHINGLEHVSIVDLSGNKLAYMYAQTAWFNASVCGRVVSMSSYVRTSFFDPDGAELFTLDRQNINIQVITSYDSLIVHDNAESAMLDWQGNEIIPFGQFDQIWAFPNDLIIINNNDKIGVVDGQGNVILPVIYEMVMPVQGHDLFVVTYDGQTGIINAAGYEIVPFGIYDSFGYKMDILL